MAKVRHRRWLYNRRSELAAATVGADRYGYTYDSIGNRLWSAANAVTNSYSANCLNQYTSVSAGANPVYDADGNMTSDGTFSYSYDAENRLVSAYPVLPSVGSVAVENHYDHRHRRVQKNVKQYDGEAWETAETHTFVWDGNNIVLEKVAFADGTTRTFEYFWGADKSSSEQGAGGVEGLLAVSMDGVFYIPCCDHNGNIVLYVSETRSIAAQYTYDPYGSVVDSYGDLADVFNFGFSTKYHDREVCMVGYQRRFYRPDLGRWLNRDPIEEEGGENLYMFCANNPCLNYDVDGNIASGLIKGLLDRIDDLKNRLEFSYSFLSCAAQTAAMVAHIQHYAYTVNHMRKDPFVTTNRQCAFTSSCVGISVCLSNLFRQAVEFGAEAVGLGFVVVHDGILKQSAWPAVVLARRRLKSLDRLNLSCPP